MDIKRVGILPWAGKDEHQLNFANALEEAGYTVVKLTYRKGMPLSNALKEDIDLLVLDWVHSFFISDSIFISLTKTILQFVDRWKIKNKKVPIVWNMHNLHRHDKKFLRLEKFNFKRLAKAVDGIRVFNQYSVQEVRKYFNLPESYPIVYIPQGAYKVFQPKGFDDFVSANKQKTTLLFFGSIRAGKGLDKFVNTFHKLYDEQLQLVIAGTPSDADITIKVKQIAEQDKRVKIIDRFIHDDEIPALFGDAFAVVLPYENILNSGVQLLAHSYSKPIVASDHPVFLNSLSTDYTAFFSIENAQSLLNAINILKERDYQNMQLASAAVLKERQWNKVVNDIINFASQISGN